jgi:hypothetical protein
VATALVRACGVLSLVAAALHTGLIGEHLSEWWGYGFFFIIASLAQAVYGLVLLAMPAQPSAWDPAQWRHWRIGLYAAGLIGNAAVVLLYLATRTVGVPLGPAAGEVEAIEPLGIATKAAELLTIAGLAMLWREAKAEAPAVASHAA